MPHKSAGKLLHLLNWWIQPHLIWVVALGTDTHVDAHTNTHTYAHTYIDKHTHAHTHKYTHIYTHTHTHTDFLKENNFK